MEMFDIKSKIDNLRREVEKEICFKSSHDFARNRPNYTDYIDGLRSRKRTIEKLQKIINEIMMINTKDTKYIFKYSFKN